MKFCVSVVNIKLDVCVMNMSLEFLCPAVDAHKIVTCLWRGKLGYRLYVSWRMFPVFIFILKDSTAISVDTVSNWHPQSPFVSIRRCFAIERSSLNRLGGRLHGPVHLEAARCIFSLLLHYVCLFHHMSCSRYTLCPRCGRNMKFGKTTRRLVSKIGISLASEGTTRPAAVKITTEGSRSCRDSYEPVATA